MSIFFFYGRICIAGEIMSNLKEIKREEIIEEVKKVPFELRSSINLDSKYTFGVEIEFENACLSNFQNIGIWKSKSENIISKITGEDILGGELTSPILRDNEDCWKEIYKKCKKLIQYNAMTSEYTGGHIHIGAQALGNDPTNIRKFLKLWELYENVIYYFSYGYSNKPRLGINVYAQPIGGKLKLNRKSLEGYTTFAGFYGWLQKFFGDAKNKKLGINFKNYRGWEEDENNTIEFRCPNGILDSAMWQNNINFFTRLTISSHGQNCDEELLDYLLSKKSDSEYKLDNFGIIDIDKAIYLSDMIYDKEIDKLLFLKQYLKLFTEEEKSRNHSV